MIDEPLNNQNSRPPYTSFAFIGVATAITFSGSLHSCSKLAPYLAPQQPPSHHQSQPIPHAPHLPYIPFQVTCHSISLQSAIAELKKQNPTTNLPPNTQTELCHRGLRSYIRTQQPNNPSQLTELGFFSNF